MFKKILSFLGLVTWVFCYENIDEALKNGVTKGDFIFYGDYEKLSHGASQNFTPNNLATYGYLGNSGYLLGNIRLGYTSGFYKNVRASISFASSISIFNQHKRLITSTGNLDTQKDFFNQNQASIGESFFEYFDGDTNIKAGRIAINNEWINTLADGFWFRNKTINRLLIETFWARTYGRIDYFQMTDFREINTKNAFGIANIGAKYDILEDLLTIKAFSYFAPEVFTAFGTRINGNYTNNNIKLGGEFGANYSIEHLSGKANTHAIDLSAFVGYKEIILFKAGYINTGKGSGWGSLGILGDKITPFFIWGGKAIKTQPNGNLFYVTISSKLQQFSFSITYGTTSFGKNSRQNEIDFTTEVGITNNVFVLLNILNTHLDSNVIPTLTQVNGGIRLKF
ncbi:MULTISPECIES: Opr family porin [unclassified Helicobacter]|uniref:Opr family porin n=1 Tax=unclassified Helicobacter TaxID=2593540 RepID=UPI000CF04DF2|nr:MULTISPECIES: Opr family porin [unclassified Helicobacter]